MKDTKTHICAPFRGISKKLIKNDFLTDNEYYTFSRSGTVSDSNDQTFITSVKDYNPPKVVSLREMQMNTNVVDYTIGLYQKAKPAKDIITCQPGQQNIDSILTIA